MWLKFIETFIKRFRITLRGKSNLAWNHQHNPNHSGNIVINQFISFYLIVMKISKLEIIATDRVSQPLYPYVKTTDYYLGILGEKSPTEAAMIDNVAILKMTADDGSSSYFNTSSHVADYALRLFKKIENWDASEIGMA